MFKREMKVNFKSFLIWTAVLIALYLMVYLVYPSIAGNEDSSKINEMVKIFPEELLKAFNMDLAAVDTAFGWLKSEGFVFIYLIIGIYAAITGATILLKEESEKTVEYMNSLPLTRTAIVLQKAGAAVIYILAMILALGIFNYAAMAVSGDFDGKQLILLSVTPVFPSLVLFALCLFISTFSHKTKKMLGICIGIVFVSYVLNVISQMGSSVDFLKFFSVFTLADSRNVILNVRLDAVLAITSVVISVAFLLLGVIRYNKKELI